MRKASIELFERHAIAEQLARKFYAHLGYGNVDSLPERYMEQSQHPQEQACYAMALTAIEFFAKTD
jgi:hypothetical protein